MIMGLFIMCIQEREINDCHSNFYYVFTFTNWSTIKRNFIQLNRPFES